MGTSKLKLYNNALQAIGERKLATLSENRKSRRSLDTAWESCVDFCLEQGYWNFALRTTKISYSPSITPEFGFSRAFSKPDDYLRTAAVSLDEYLREPFDAYADEIGYLFADVDEMYFQYVSNDAAYGNNLGAWPETFSEFVEAYLAKRVVFELTQDKAMLDIAEKAYKKCLLNAQGKDAMNQPARHLPAGRLVRARHAGIVNYNGDRLGFH